MKYFKTLQDLLDYVPNCLICGKILQLSIEGHWGNSSIFDKTEFRAIQTSYKENLLYSKHKIYSFCLDPKNNEIISGKTFFKILSDRYISVYKKCHTCYCILKCSLADKQYKIHNFFSDLILDNEEIRYTMRNKKEISIYKNHGAMYYYSNPSVAGNNKMSITLNGKRMHYPNEYIDFSKIKNLSDLNKKISTIMVFQ